MSLLGRTSPRCLGCMKEYAWGNAANGVPSALSQQVRGKKKLANTSSTVPVRLLKDVKTFGRKGSIVPIAMGQMRNEWFPRRIAEYVTLPEQRRIRNENIPVQRDFNFGTAPLATKVFPAQGDSGDSMSGYDVINASMFQKKTAPDRIDPERSIELLEIFVSPKGVEFYRQPIIEEKEPEPEPEPEKPKRSADIGFGAGSELLAARASTPKAPPKPVAPQAIYGSVSTKDVLNAVKAAMATNDEASRVALNLEDVKFVGLKQDDDAAEMDRVKHVGEYVVEIGVKGAERSIRRPVKVIAQESA